MMTQEWQGNKYYDDTGMTRLTSTMGHRNDKVTSTMMTQEWQGNKYYDDTGMIK